ncbi:unnamed protein product [Arabidopsis halleri]
MKFQSFKRNIFMEVEGIDLIEEVKRKKTKKTAPKSDLKLLVKSHDGGVIRQTQVVSFLETRKQRLLLMFDIPRKQMDKLNPSSYLTSTKKFW